MKTDPHACVTLLRDFTNYSKCRCVMIYIRFVYRQVWHTVEQTCPTSSTATAKFCLVMLCCARFQCAPVRRDLCLSEVWCTRSFVRDMCLRECAHARLACSKIPKQYLCKSPLIRVAGRTHVRHSQINTDTRTHTQSDSHYGHAHTYTNSNSVYNTHYNTYRRYAMGNVWHLS